MSGVLLYLLGFSGAVLMLASISLVMPAGRLTLRHALIGAVVAALLWELSRHVLLWYFETLSQISTVYGSLTTAIAVLLSLEVGATLLLLGAQVISEYERIGRPGAASAVGAALGKNPVPPIVPCHRVVARGGIGGFSSPGGLGTKRKLLAAEGVKS